MMLLVRAASLSLTAFILKSRIVSAALKIASVTGFFAQARALRLADGPDEVHKGMIAKLELAKRGYASKRKS